jgi:hypothetical protein
MDPKQPITSDNQHQPDQQRAKYLDGVIAEAHRNGYSMESVGRLVVVALRAWEGR